MSTEYLWTEKYRPKTIGECVLTPELTKTFKGIVDTGEVPTLLLAGRPGGGKTTAAKALCNELSLDHILINCSDESGIETLRGKIKQFASSVSLTGDIKVVIMDESDYMTPKMQPALLGVIEEFSSNCRFIFTCNYKHRIIEPIHSRCAVIEFDVPKKALAPLCGAFMTRLEYILKAESVEYEPKVIAGLIMQHAPDWRRVINECQRYGSTGKINTDILASGGEANIEALIKHLSEKDFKGMRQWVADNASLDSTAIFRQIYDGAYDYMEPESIPASILILADYDYKNAFVSDKELNLVAAMTELMGGIKWKS